MTIKPLIFLVMILAAIQLGPLLNAQELDGSDLRRELLDRQQRVNKLPLEDQLKLRAAQQKAAEDPAVKAALEVRDKAMEEYRATVRAAIIRADPTVKPILDKVAIPVKKR